MSKKIGRFLRKCHRFLTPIFVGITLLNMTILKGVPIIVVSQKVLMLTMAASGTYLYVQIKVNQHKSKKRKQSMLQK